MSMLLGLPNSGYVTLDDTAQYGYEFSRVLDKKDIRTTGGKLFTYIVPDGQFRRFTIPATFVNSSDRSVINSFFVTGTDIRFIDPQKGVRYVCRDCKLLLGWPSKDEISKWANK